MRPPTAIHRRSLSLAPTRTEILAALGLGEEIVGITEDPLWREASFAR